MLSFSRRILIAMRHTSSPFWLLALLLLAGALPLPGKPSLQVRVDKNVLSLQEPLELTIILSDDEEPLKSPPQNFPLPSGLPFQVAHQYPPANGQSSRMQIINGKATRSFSSSVTYTFQVIPRQEGECTIPSLTLDYQGRTLRSEPITLQVTREGTGGKPKGMEYQMRLSRNRSVPGVPLTLTLECLLPQSLALRHVVPSLDLDSLQDDFAISTPKLSPSGQTLWNQETVLQNGVPYRRISLEMELTPRRPGSYTIPVSTLEILYTEADPQPTSFFGFLDFPDPFSSRMVQETLISPAVTLEVEDFPQEGRPDGFSGLLGPLQVSASVDQTSPRVGDPIQLTLRLQGEGLSPQSTLPAWEKEVESLTAFKCFGNDPLLPEEDGSLLLQRTLRPLRPGPQEIPSINIPFYDPQKREYGVATSDPIPLSVQAADEATLPTLPPTTPQGKTPPKAQAARTDTPSPAEAPQGSLLPSRDILLWCLLLPAALLALGGLLKGGLSLRKRYLASPRTQARTARKNLERELDGLDENAPRATAQAARAYETFLCQRLHLTTPITPHSLEEAWNRHNLPAHLLPSFQTLQEHCDAAQYGLLSIPLAQLKEEILDAVQNL